MFATSKALKRVAMVFLFTILSYAKASAGSTTVQIVADSPVLANARMTEIERKGSTYLGQHVLGFVGDSVELQNGIHKIVLDAPNDYLFDFSITVGDESVTVSDVSVTQKNCKPELKAAWAGPKVSASKRGAATVTLPTPQFGPPTGELWCTSPIVMACPKQRVVLDVRTTPPGAEIWIDGYRQPFRTNQLVETELEVCGNKVDVLLRHSGMTNCHKRVFLPAASGSRVSCAFDRMNAK